MSEEERFDWTFLFNNGDKKSINASKEQMLIAFRKSAAIFVVRGDGSNYSFVEGQWIPFKINHEEGENTNEQ